MIKLKKAYSEKKGLCISMVRFTFDWERLKDEDTFASRGMEDGDGEFSQAPPTAFWVPVAVS